MCTLNLLGNKLIVHDLMSINRRLTYCVVVSFCIYDCMISFFFFTGFSSGNKQILTTVDRTSAKSGTEMVQRGAKKSLLLFVSAFYALFSQ